MHFCKSRDFLSLSQKTIEFFKGESITTSVMKDRSENNKIRLPVNTNSEIRLEDSVEQEPETSLEHDSGNSLLLLTSLKV